MPVGSSQKLAFELGNGANWAVHGGGSCQISVTYETDPQKLKDPSSWKVIYSIEEGCPTNSKANLNLDFPKPGGSTYTGAYDCSDADTNGIDCVNSFNFTIPKELKNGQATLAWTWFNNVGNREMYMNCANVEISGGASDDSDMSSLPEMFVANLASINGGTCGSTESVNVQFPNPGQYVTTKTASSRMSMAYTPFPMAIPSGCGAVSAAPSAAPTSAPAASGAGSMTYGASTTTNPAALSALSSAYSSVTETASISLYSQPAKGVTHVTVTTLATVTGYPPASSAAASSAAPSAAPSVASAISGNSTSSGSCDSGKVSCPSPGSIVCIGTSQFGLCNIDNCAVLEVLSPGTQCSNGVISGSQKFKRSRVHRHSPHQFNI
ncbi:hypothetical protein H2203_002158 [Taxawa tesnikishii (nom. ined.)]|nr:hypothetical protein H2203_002158 [Dothideales sp. JES 119]